MKAEPGIQEDRDHRAPKGILVAVGGNEDKEHDLFILRSIRSLVSKKMVRIEVMRGLPGLRPAGRGGT